MYLNTKLTYADDKIFAIAGIVDIVRKSTGMTNISGMWLEVLQTQLTWKEDACIHGTR